MKQETMDYFLGELLNPNKGLFLIKGFLQPNQVDRYRLECEQFLLVGKRESKRVNKRNIPDYIHQKTILPNGKKRKNEAVFDDSSIYRIYQFLHNRHSPETEDIFNKTLTLRNQIEENWIHNEVYKRKKESLDDYIQATKYVQDSHGLPKHTDLKQELPYPLLQCVILLSQPEIDYLGGELIFYTKMNTPIKAQSDLKMEKGDALFFDKSLFHEVEPTSASKKSDIGRWTVIIGARHPKPPKLSQQIKKLFLGPFNRVRRHLVS